MASQHKFKSICEYPNLSSELIHALLSSWSDMRLITGWSMPTFRLDVFRKLLVATVSPGASGSMSSLARGGSGEGDGEGEAEVENFR